MDHCIAVILLHVLQGLTYTNWGEGKKKMGKEIWDLVSSMYLIDSPELEMHWSLVWGGQSTKSWICLEPSAGTDSPEKLCLLAREGNATRMLQEHRQHLHFSSVSRAFPSQKHPQGCELALPGFDPSSRTEVLHITLHDLTKHQNSF